MQHSEHSRPRLDRRERAAQAEARRHWQRGVAAGERGAWHEAEGAFARAAAAAPRDLLMWLNLAHARRNRGDIDGALQAIGKCLTCDARHQVARALAGELIGRHLGAGAVAQRLASLPAEFARDPELLSGAAEQLLSARHPLDAVSVLMRALAVAPAHVPAHELLLYCMRDLGMRNEAAECAKTVLALRPDHLPVRMHLMYDQRGACNWSGLAQTCTELVTAVQAMDADAALPLPVFSLLSVDVDAAVQLRAARVATRYLSRGVVPLPALHAGRRRPGALRIGFLSYDFREHPVAQLLSETIEQLDRRRCHVSLYAHGPADDSAWRQRLKDAADSFVAFDGGGGAGFVADSDATIADRIRADAIDVLVDLGGHTRGSRLAVLAYRPAPVQVAYLGYPGSTGCAHADYLVGDAIVTPIDQAAHYSEKIAQLPGCLLPASRHRPLPQPLSRADVGLPDDALVLCAFNQVYKLLPATFDIWCDALRAAPRAVLWLKAPNPDAVCNLQREAAARGVEPQRLIFAADRVSYGDHFSRLALADLFVDTWPYNAHTTAADALWSGLPVLTLCGDVFAARVGASLLRAAGLGDFVLDDPQAYRARLLELVADPGPLAAARERLQRERQRLAIFDSGAYASDLLALFERMHERWLRGLAPEHLQACAAAAPPVEPAPASAAAPMAAATAPIRLHIGGRQVRPGWQILNIQAGPGVDHVGDLSDLSAFADGCAQQIYASHVLEHVPQQRVRATLRGLHRLLLPGGQLMVSVPDLEVLSRVILDPHTPTPTKFLAMRMIFGGQVDAHDFHYFGWTFDFMREFLREAGFARVERVESFGLFEDTSDCRPWGFPISLNVVATR